MKIYRFLTGPDDSSFCRRITEALQNGWELYGDPQLTGDANGRYCGQAVVKESATATTPPNRLGTTDECCLGSDAQRRAAPAL